MTSARLARAIEVHPNTVARWTTGKAKVPGAVITYLELLAKLKALAADRTAGKEPRG
jgi:DNA-binding transcriptional regulator YiaG